MQSMKNKFVGIISLAMAALVLSPAAAFAAPAEPATVIFDEVKSLVATNVPLILAGLAVVLVAGLGVTMLWTAYKNGKKGVRSIG
jgi:hypothetical protein